jgi:hypothetical protein
VGDVFDHCIFVAAGGSLARSCSEAWEVGADYLEAVEKEACAARIDVVGGEAAEGVEEG